MSDKLWILGSAGWMPAAGRETSCFLMELDDELVMLDAGTGVANLSLVPEVLERHDRLSIVLSHYHLDHVIGLMYLRRFTANKRVDVYGPGQPVYPRTTAAYVADLLQDALYSAGHLGFAREVHFHDYAGCDFRVGNVTVFVRRQEHSAASFELRLADAVTYATDTTFRPSAWEDPAPTQVLLHECWQQGNADPRHTSIEALATGLPLDRFHRTLLIHQNPEWDSATRDEVTRIAKEAGMQLASDGMCIDLA